MGWQQPHWKAESSHGPVAAGLAAVAAAVQEPAPSCTWNCDCSRMNFLMNAGVTPVKNDQPRPEELWLVCQNKSCTARNHLGAEFVVELGLHSCGDEQPQPLRLVLEEQTSLLY